MTDSETPPLVHVSTEQLPRVDQFACFRDAIASVYIGIDPQWPHEKYGFKAQFATQDLGGAVLAHLSMPGHSARRDAHPGRDPSGEYLFLNFCEDSDYEVDDGLDPGRVPHRTPRLHDNRKSATLRFPPGRRVTLHTLRLPRRHLSPGMSPSRLNATLTTTSLGHLVTEQFGLLCQAARLANPHALAAIGRSLEALVLVLARGEIATTDGFALRTPARCMKDFARARLGDPTLSPALVAATFHCTVRTVQNRFAREGDPFSVWLLRERLAHARSLLRDPASHPGIEAVSRACGFVSVAHFHRAFKARFGLSPGACRDA
jgi:AraC family transcriptional regulator, positive regulator of tynA and feaB